MKLSPSRRRLLKQVGVVSGVAAAAPLIKTLLAMRESAEVAVVPPSLVGSSAMAASTGPGSKAYKALVCVYLGGGNDAFNTVTYDVNHTTPHGKPRERYLQARNNLGLADHELLSMDESGARAGMAFHGELKRVHALYRQKRVAVVANVGPLHEVTTNETVERVKTPPKLYSHNDQTSTWQTGGLEGQRSGWGGGFMRPRDAAAAPSTFGAISMDQTSAITAMLDGSVLAFGASSNEGALKPGGVFSGQALFDDDFMPNGEALLWPVLQGTVGQTGDSAHWLEADYTARTAKALSSWETLISRQALRPLAPQEADPALMERNTLAHQLAMVARFVRSRDQLGVSRQVFFVQLGGFDTHTEQKTRHAALLAQLDEALGYFDEVLGADRDLVTTFTASDFGRNLHQNSTGTDHGWGGHHLVMGGAQVSGGQCFGRFPDISRYKAPRGNKAGVQGEYGDPQMLSTGAMIPEVSVDQFAYQLGQWFGVPGPELEQILPHYQSTRTALDLGFLKFT